MGLLRLLFHSRVTLLRALVLARDARVPSRIKFLGLLGAALIVSPLNVLQCIPLLGIVDDAILFSLLLSWFVRAAEAAMASATIEGTAIVIPAGSTAR